MQDAMALCWPYSRYLKQNHDGVDSVYGDKGKLASAAALLQPYYDRGTSKACFCYF